MVLLHSDAVYPGDNNVEKGRVLKTVRRNFEGWTKREVKEAKSARTLQLRVDNIDTEGRSECLSLPFVRRRRRLYMITVCIYVARIQKGLGCSLVHPV